MISASWALRHSRTACALSEVSDSSAMMIFIGISAELKLRAGDRPFPYSQFDSHQGPYEQLCRIGGQRFGRKRQFLRLRVDSANFREVVKTIFIVPLELTAENLLAK